MLIIFTKISALIYAPLKLIKIQDFALIAILHVENARIYLKLVALNVQVHSFFIVLNVSLTVLTIIIKILLFKLASNAILNVNFVLGIAWLCALCAMTLMYCLRRVVLVVVQSINIKINRRFVLIAIIYAGIVIMERIILALIACLLIIS